MNETVENLPAPNWLDNLEKLREKRLQRRLGHETGAGAPCLNCNDKCPGLDLHFWRKICKNCKCGKENHDVEPDNIYDCIQFQLLGTKPIKSRGFVLPGKKTLTNLEFTPLGASSTVQRYLTEIPIDLLPVSGSEAARTRRQRLVTQLPAHDIDATLCDNLTPIELQLMDEYVSHVRQHCIGQGKLVEFPLHAAEIHSISQPNIKILTDQVSKQLAVSETVPLKQSALANSLSGLSLRDQQSFNADGSNPINQTFDNISNNKNISNSNYPVILNTNKLVDPQGQLMENDIANSNIKQSNQFNCHDCKKNIVNGDISIQIIRSPAHWHPECFKCFKCHETLADFLYFFDKISGEIYCGRDYAEIRGIPRCAACDELVFVKEYCSAENSTFHIKHFCCWHCDIPLAGKQYVLENQKPHCLPCFENTKAAKCKECGGIIKADQQGVSLQESHWHAQTCFICHQCRKTLLGGKMLMKERNVYCSPTCVALATSNK